MSHTDSAWFAPLCVCSPARAESRPRRSRRSRLRVAAAPSAPVAVAMDSRCGEPRHDHDPASSRGLRRRGVLPDSVVAAPVRRFRGRREHAGGSWPRRLPTLATRASGATGEAGSHGGANELENAVTWDIDVETYNSHTRVQYYLDFFQGTARERYGRLAHPHARVTKR